jgi:hypothetical protein
MFKVPTQNPQVWCAGIRMTSPSVTRHRSYQSCNCWQWQELLLLRYWSLSPGLSPQLIATTKSLPWLPMYYIWGAIEPLAGREESINLLPQSPVSLSLWNGRIYHSSNFTSKVIFPRTHLLVAMLSYHRWFQTWRLIKCIYGDVALCVYVHWPATVCVCACSLLSDDDQSIQHSGIYNASERSLCVTLSPPTCSDAG